jgi:hypothetical protein
VRYPCHGNSELVTSNSSIATIGGYDNASVALADCKVDSITAGDKANFMSADCTFNVDAQILATNLNHSLIGLVPGVFKYRSFVTNCTIQGTTVPHLTVADTQVGNWRFPSQGYFNATISKSEIGTLRFLDSSRRQLSNVIT